MELNKEEGQVSDFHTTAESPALAHDLNNDLSIILGCCDLLSEAFADGSDEAKRLELIRQSALRIAGRIAKRPVNWADAELKRV